MKKKKNKDKYLNRMMTTLKRISKSTDNAFKKEKEAVDKMSKEQKSHYLKIQYHNMFPW